MTTPGCRKARDWAAQMFAGEMEPEARRELDSHVRACPVCAAEEENIRRALSLLKTEDPPDPGAPYWSSFGGRLRTRIAAYQRRRRTLRLAVLAAAAVLVAALALLRPRHEVPPRQIAEGPDDLPSILRALLVEARYVGALDQGTAPVRSSLE